jgi:hypothetical protein
MTATNELSAPERLAAMLVHAMLEPDPERAADLSREYSEAFADACSELWGQRLWAKRLMLDEAERLLDGAEASDDPAERRKLLSLFELCMSAAAVK